MRNQDRFSQLPLPNILDLREMRRRFRDGAVRSKEFDDALRQASREISEISFVGQTESTVEGNFERVLYALLREIDYSFQPIKEESIATKRHVGKGRTDSRIGAVVIEYKRPGLLGEPAQLEKATRQLETYCESLSISNQSRIFGFLTDGVTCREIQADPGVLPYRTPNAPLTHEDLKRLCIALVSLEQTALTADNLVRDFCGNDGLLTKLAKTFYDLVATSPAPKTQMLWQEWMTLFRLGHNDKSQQPRILERRKQLGLLLGRDISSAIAEYQALFSLHSAYALLVKWIAFRVLTEVSQGDIQLFSHHIDGDTMALRAFCEQLEDGAIFRQYGILNLLEGDFFSWYSSEEQWDSGIDSGIRGLLIGLSKYEETAVVFEQSGAVDLFRDLYEGVMPPAVRSSFGEFYTPTWLAQHVMEDAEYSPGKRVLDPCCGSGTFLIVLIRKARNNGLNTKDGHSLRVITSTIVGFDINPLAVLTSRVNYFIHVADLIPDQNQPLVIPVFLGDACAPPQFEDLDGISCAVYGITTEMGAVVAKIPTELVKQTEAFCFAMLDFEKAIRRPLNDVQTIRPISDQLASNMSNSMVQSELLRLASEIRDLQSRNWNGIWARVFSNYLAVACLDKFDIVIGNPPWIDWKNLPAGYRERIKGLCLDRGLFSGDGFTGGINLNVCALISFMSTENWLKPAGILAFLMPKELLYQQSYEGWRRSFGQRGIKRLVDWSKAGHPFDPVQDDFCTYLIGDVASDDKVIVLEKHKNRRGGRASEWKSLYEAKKHLEVMPSVAGRLRQDSSAYTIAKTDFELEQFRRVAGRCDYIGREGIEFYPQELLLFKYMGPGPTAATVRLRNLTFKKSKFRIPEQDVILEKAFLYPLVKGPGIDSFRYEDPHIIVPFPYSSEKGRAPLSEEELDNEAPRLLEYYKRYKTLIEEQTGFSDKIQGRHKGEFYGLARVGLYSFAPFHVGFRDNTKWRVTVFSEKTMPWGDTQPFLFQNHAASICERSDGIFIHEQEAFYVAAILGAPIVAKYLDASSDSRSFKIRPPVHVPLFNPSNRLHLELAELGKQLSTCDFRDQDNLLQQVDTAYLTLCDSR